MIAKTTVYLIMYDITHDKTLQKIARIVEQNGYERLNYSVWYGTLNPLKDTEFKKKLKTLLINPQAKGSRMFCMPLSIKAFEKMRHYDGKPIAEMEYWTGKVKTAFF